MSNGDGGPAFPSIKMVASDDGQRISADVSLRDWFAGMALAHTNDFTLPKNIAKSAYEIADAMIAAREVKP